MMQPFPNLHVRQNRDAMAQEAEAYRRLHPTFVQQLLGTYVAIYQGQVADHDPDEDALLTRLRQALPEETILVRKVEAEPERELYISSFRLCS